MSNKNFYIIIGVIFLVAVVGTLFARRKRSEYEIEADENIHEPDLTYNEAEYSAMAESLYTAMAGCGTDEIRVLNTILKMKNESDWYKLVKKFGLRYYDSWTCSNDEGNLIEWINSEIEGYYLDEISKHLNSLGVTF